MDPIKKEGGFKFGFGDFFAGVYSLFPASTDLFAEGVSLLYEGPDLWCHSCCLALPRFGFADMLLCSFDDDNYSNSWWLR